MVDTDFKESEKGEAPGKKGGFRNILIIVIVVLAVGVGAFFAGKWFPNGGEKGNTAAQAEDKGTKTGESTGLDINNPAESSGNPQEGKVTGESRADPGFLALETFTVNLNDPFGKRYLECVLNLVLNDKSLVPKIKENELLMAKIRHEIFMTISAKSYEELKGTAGKITLFEEIQMRVNETLKDKLGVEPVVEVLQTKFLMQ